MQVTYNAVVGNIQREDSSKMNERTIWKVEKEEVGEGFDRIII